LKPEPVTVTGVDPVSGPLRGEMDVTEMGASKVKGAAEDEKSRPFNDTVRGTVEGEERGEWSGYCGVEPEVGGV
jgi:hypothetical protein